MKKARGPNLGPFSAIDFASISFNTVKTSTTKTLTLHRNRYTCIILYTKRDGVVLIVLVVFITLLVKASEQDSQREMS